MNKRDQIQQEILQLTGSTYGRTTDRVLQKIQAWTKKVNQYTLDGELINTFNSVYECANKTKLNATNIKKSIQTNRPHESFVFLWEDQEFIAPKKKQKSGANIKPVNLLTKEGKVLMTAYKYKDITDYLGLECTINEATKICHSISGRTKTYRKQYIIKTLD